MAPKEEVSTQSDWHTLFSLLIWGEVGSRHVVDFEAKADAFIPLNVQPTGGSNFCQSKLGSYDDAIYYEAWSTPGKHTLGETQRVTGTPAQGLQNPLCS